MTQQARQLTWRLADEGIKLGYVIHDRDKKFAPQADAVLKSESARILLTPLMALLANSVAERWVGSCRREVLDRLLILNQRHLEAVLGEFCLHYNDEHPHRSCGLRPPSTRGDPPATRLGEVRRRVRLAGLVSEYYREAMAA